MPEGWLGDLSQFWTRQITTVVVGVAAFLAAYWIAPGPLSTIPQEALGTLFASFATLLGLTFTAFSILAVLIPNLRRDYVASRTFLVMGRTYVIAMWLEALTMVVSGFAFLTFGEPWVRWVSGASVLLGFVSIGFVLRLMQFTWILFRMARTEAIRA